MTDYIFSHHDCDGIISTHLIKTYLSPNAKVTFQKWYNFGINYKDLPEQADTIYVLDLGVKKTTLDSLAEWSLQHPSSKVILLDHHEPQGINPMDYASPNFQIVHDTEQCTSSITYLFVKAMNREIEPIDEQLTIIGIFGDVAYELKGTQPLLAELKEKYPELFWNFAYWTGKYEAKLPIPSLYSRFLSVGKRLAFEKGAELGLKAVEEIKRAGTLAILEDFLEWLRNPKDPTILQSREQDLKYPYCTILKYWYHLWTEIRDEILSERYVKTLDFSNFQFCLINHPLSVASWVAFVKSQHKPCIAVNYGIQGDYAELSGRAKEEQGINLVNIATLVNEQLRTDMGGHECSIGGTIPKKIPTLQVIRAFEKAFTGQTGWTESFLKLISESEEKTL